MEYLITSTLIILFIVFLIFLLVYEPKYKYTFGFKEFVFTGDNIDKLQELIEKAEFILTNNDKGELLVINPFRVPHSNSEIIEVGDTFCYKDEMFFIIKNKD